MITVKLFGPILIQSDKEAWLIEDAITQGPNEYIYYDIRFKEKIYFITGLENAIITVQNILNNIKQS